MNSTRVAVVGGGITGLAAAWQLIGDGHQVVVFEASGQLGGKLRSSPFAGLDGIDEGADAFLARVPEARQLATEVGLGDSLVSPVAGSAFVASRGRIHPLPDGLVLGVPAGLGGLARSRLLSWPGKARAVLDLVRAPSPSDHDCLGTLIRDRFGDEVAERLVDPLVGSINAGDADELSLVASTPQIAAVAGQRSLLRALRAAPPSAPGPVFQTPRSGMASLPAAITRQLVAAGADVRVATPARSCAPCNGGWLLNDEVFDAVIVASPAKATATLLGEVAPQAADAIGQIPAAGVVMVTLAVTAGSMSPVPPGSGLLVPKPEQRTVTAISFASRKWAHWRPDGVELLRVSLGHFRRPEALELDIASAIAAAVDESNELLRIDLDVTDARVTRWPEAFPQYLPHHFDRVGHIERVLANEAPGIVVAGASYRGIGVPACIRHGRSMAQATSKWLSARAE